MTMVDDKEATKVGECVRLQFFVDKMMSQSFDRETITMVDENDTEATAGPSGTDHA